MTDCAHVWVGFGPGWIGCESCGEARRRPQPTRWAVSGMDGVRFLSWNDADSAARRTGGEVLVIW